MRNRHKFAFIICFAVADMIAMVIGSIVFLNFATEGNILENSLFLNKMIPITVLSWLFSVAYFQLYRVNELFSLQYFFRNSWRSFLTQRVLWHGYIFIFNDDVLYFFGSKANLFQLSFLLFYFSFSRILFTIVVGRIKNWVLKHYTVAIWGFNKTSIELAAHLEANSFFIHFVGIINENANESYGSSESFGRALSAAIHKASMNKVNELYIVANSDYISDLSYFFELGDKYCMRLKFVPDFSAITKKDFASTHLDNFHVIKPRFEPLQNAYNRLLKRIFDIAVSSLVIVFVLSWLYPILAIIIKKQSEGPVLFKQLRTGKKNESFWCYKFRSMYINNSDESQQARKGDDRITPIGRFLRRSSLDEMPQFFNVFIGNMSVVGPRPHMIKHTEDYNDHINNFMVRHFVKPGITGLAQVTGLRGETKKVSDMKRRVNTDIQYVQRWSIITDIKICFLTVAVTIKGDENAY